MPPLLSYRLLVEANGTYAARMTDFTTAFSSLDYARPEVKWKTPMQGGVATKGGTAVVVVTNFRVGAGATEDGYVKVTFTNGTGCTEITGDTDTSMGKGEINLTIPAACMGSTVTMIARLVDFNGADLVPPVSAAINGITIN
jgi:hypothetical protein